MHFHKNINIRAFLQDVQKCRSDVCFRTREGDMLNLKSKLSEYVFLAAAVSTQDILSGGEIVLSDPDDIRVLSAHIYD